jgi:2-(1,2-epoxy-1,2-dihydrophenyl)acetyl-CoA isomerase
MTTFQTIKLERSGPMATLTINRPDSRNGMTNRMVRECHEALAEIAGDDGVRLLMLTGAGDTFCPGADLNWISDPQRDPEDSCEPYHFQVPALLHSMPQLTVAAINGACAGAGFGWACGCDIRVAARRAMLNTAFLNVAVAGDMGLPWSLPRLVGAAKARELSFFTEKFSADEAQAMGLVARVYDDEAFEVAVASLCERLLGFSPTALRALKAHYVAAEELSFEAYLDRETAAHLSIAAGPHAAEAFRAFIEKRKPQFD